MCGVAVPYADSSGTVFVIKVRVYCLPLDGAGGLILPIGCRVSRMMVQCSIYRKIIQLAEVRGYDWQFYRKPVRSPKVLWGYSDTLTSSR